MPTALLQLVFMVLLLPAGGLPPAMPQSAYPGNTRSPHGPLAILCQNCHTFTAWKPIRNIPEFDHNKTRFPLRGMHQNVACTQCHTKPVFTNVGNKCSDCHADIHRRQMGANCERCHTVKGWNVSVQAIQNHQNRFPLVGAHAMLNCDSCHKGAAAAQFIGLSTDCYSCHAKTYQSTIAPNHAQAGFPTQCQQCHDMNTWFSASFDHLKFTGFALTGAHAQLPCTTCHAGGHFVGTSATCIGCHQKDFAGAKNPDHIAAAFPTTCQTCHSTTAWQPATFNHNTFTRFPLTGAHINVPCQQCHVNGQYAGTPTACSGCHTKDFQGAKNPDHVAGGFPNTCQTCHNTTAWQPATFDHNTFTKFPLTGAHVSVPCQQCHVNGQFAGTPSACSGCHMKDYQNTTNPNHAQAGFPTDCSVCHSTTSWAGAQFDHSKTAFPLTGAHTSLSCQSCHSSGVYAGLSTACYSCHQKDYQGTTDPNHAQAGFPTDCTVCHTTATWSGATFDHNKTAFPLTGKHTTTPCASCHIGGVYKGTPTDCYSCHKVDYQGTNNPNHAAAGFPTTCATCHTTSTWLGAVFNHTWFPVPHRTATLCTDCHTNQSNFAVFVCTNCHTQTETNRQHSGVRNYVWNSANCYACHPTGRGG